MVRLEGCCPDIVINAKPLFQFLYGAIGRFEFTF